MIQLFKHHHIHHVLCHGIRIALLIFKKQEEMFGLGSLGLREDRVPTSARRPRICHYLFYACGGLDSVKIV